MAFRFQLNKSPANFVGSYMYLWQTMVQAGWTVMSWSDGSTVHGAAGAGFLGFSTASDGTPNHAGGANSANNTNAWILMQQPPATAGAWAPPYGGFRQLTFQRGSSTSVWRIKYSHSGSYTAPATAGTAAATPVQNATLADEVILAGGGTDAAPTFTTMFTAGGFEGVMHTHCLADDGSGSSPYGFCMVTIPNGLGTSVLGNFLFDPLLSGTAAPGDIDPFVFYSDNNSSEVIFSFTITNVAWALDTSGGIFSPHGWYRKGQTGSGFQPCAALFPYTFNSYLVAGKNNPNVGGTGMGANHITGLDDIFTIPYVRRSTQTSPTGYKGFSSIMRGNANGRFTGDTLSLVNPGVSRDRLVVNSCNIPWDGVTIPIV